MKPGQVNEVSSAKWEGGCKLMERAITRWAHYYAKCFPLVDVQDLEQIGRLAVRKALVKYNGTSSFSTYAYQWIRSDMSVACQNSSAIKGLPCGVWSLDAPANDDSDLALGDLLIAEEAPEENLEDVAREKIATLISRLKPQEQEVVRLRAAGLNATEIGKQLGVTHQRVCFILKTTLTKLRKRLNSWK